MPATRICFVYLSLESGGCNLPRAERNDPSGGNAIPIFKMDIEPIENCGSPGLPNHTVIGLWSAVEALVPRRRETDELVEGSVKQAALLIQLNSPWARSFGQDVSLHGHDKYLLLRSNSGVQMLPFL